jgi:hypothetical protein
MGSRTRDLPVCSTLPQPRAKDATVGNLHLCCIKEPTVMEGSADHFNRTSSKYKTDMLTGLQDSARHWSRQCFGNECFSFLETAQECGTGWLEGRGFCTNVRHCILLKWLGILMQYNDCDRLCGLVIRVPGYRSRGLGSILGATTFSQKSGTGFTTSSIQLRSYSEQKVAALV